MSSLAEQHLVALAERAGATAATSDLVAALAMQSVQIGPDGAIKIVDANGNERVGSGPSYGPMNLRELVDEIAHAKPVLFRRPEPQAEPVPAKPPQAPAEPPAAKPAGKNLTVDFLRRNHGEEAAARAEAAIRPTLDTRAQLAADVAEVRERQRAVQDWNNPVNAAQRRTAESIERHRAGPEAKPDMGNPFLRSQWNLTAQAMVSLSDPVRAAKLIAEAGAIPEHLDKPRSPFNRT